MSDAPVRYSVSDGVGRITLDRPEAKNRLDPEGMAAMLGHLRSAAGDSSVRAVVITGTGSTFCAGADLAAAAAGGGFAADAAGGYAGLLAAMLDHPKPLVARVQGHVAGGGNGLVACCDLAVASAEARFAFSEVRVGVAPAVVAVACLQVMERRMAQRLLLTGERVDAAEALSAGLLTSVAPADGLDAAVEELVAQLRLGGPQAISQTKALLRRIPAMPERDAFAWAAEMSASLFSSAEAREGMTAFLEKRPPSWA